MPALLMSTSRRPYLVATTEAAAAMDGSEVTSSSIGSTTTTPPLGREEMAAWPLESERVPIRMWKLGSLESFFTISKPTPWFAPLMRTIVLDDSSVGDDILVGRCR